MPSKTKKATATPAPEAPQTAPDDDVSMPDADADAGAEVEEAEAHREDFMTALEGQKIRILPGSTDTAASFEFLDENHTLGNALRWVIMKNPDVEFCGYTIPHPSEAKMNVRIQTYEGTTAFEALEKGFDDLMDLCDVVADKFAAERVSFASRNSD